MGKNKYYLKYLNPHNYVNRLKLLFISFLSPILRIWEKKLINKYGKMPLKFQPVFIIGAPRTGSTILYQALTNHLDILYIDNLACRWSKNLIFGMWLSQKIYNNKPHNNFKAIHGNTNKFGLNSPSECGSYWYRWLPQEHHFIDTNNFNDKVVEEIRNEITSIINYHNKPMLFKNLNAGQRICLLKQCFPNAKYIFIRRDPLFVVHSILTARKKANIKEDQWWSVRPKNYQELLKLPKIEMIAAQVFYIEEQIKHDLKYITADNVIEIYHHNLSPLVINDIAKWMRAKRYEDRELPLFIKDDTRKLRSEDERKLKSAIAKYSIDVENIV